MARRLHRLSSALGAVPWGSGVVEVLGSFSITPHPDPPPFGGERILADYLATSREVGLARGRAVHLDAGRDLLLHHRHPPPPPALGHSACALPLLLCHRLRPATPHPSLLAPPPLPALPPAF